MIAPAPTAASPADPNGTNPAAPPERALPPTPLSWRFGILGAVAAIGFVAYLLHGSFGSRFQAGCGIVCFLGLAAALSSSLQSVSRTTLLWGIGLQFALAVVIIHPDPLESDYFNFRWVRWLFEAVGAGIKALITSSDKGADFVFGTLSDPGGKAGFVFAFKALPPIIFVSSFFSVLYHLGVLQFFVKLMARVMMYLMGTSGAETLSVSANVFMGQTEAPLIVKPYVPRMTKSELLALMGSGMAHISGGMMAVYISYGADPVAILCTCVMACPCSLYLTKLVCPEAGKPETLGTARVAVETPYVNVIDAAAAGVKDGLWLALNVAAMLIAFIAFIALFDIVLAEIKPAVGWCGEQLRDQTGVGFTAADLAWWPDGLKLEKILGWLFAPVAFLLGVEPAECQRVGSLLGIKLAANEHVAYLTLKDWTAHNPLTERSRMLAVYALTGFANFASVGIQLGGIGAIAPGRRADLAKLGMKALFIGFLATLINAAVAGMLMNRP
ncbi:nucleoside transporter C-terminal domain-containing protein [Gemmata sp. JC717]|uniref:Na+ dependent nucleoside transporter domain protein n=1 Tax=Gemmata algarum TaxID=2975278 RepID=A0ABU5F2X1_9BACT|nr:nucleoside transporter C-terminal domain-containing protein [Gemmata algarum]MDY3551700.1 nucleoside transporter C-terminal domain-containing protein [Gemmata algarum]MDY3561751.1 Na+ dependent nucleoside transporter domain protein [Gemmata algarum]